MKFFLLSLTLSFFAMADIPLLQGEARYEVLDRPYATGRVNPPFELKYQIPSSEYLKSGANAPVTFDLRNIAELTPIKDQEQCGSCVYVCVTAMVEDEYRLHGKMISILSPQHAMDCSAREWMCQGSFFSKVAGGIVQKGGIAKLSEYPYNAKNQQCKSGQFTLEGKLKGYKIIDNSKQNIIGVLNELHPVATTIGAGGPMMSYKGGGVMKSSSCQNVGTNHQMEIVGYSCGKSVDATGKNCAFDSAGELVGKAASEGYWIIRNSWGLSYGEKGYLYISMYNTQGKHCNNVTEEVGIVETDLVPVPPVPVGKDFAIENEVAVVKGTVKAPYTDFYDNIVKVFKEFLDSFKE